MNTASAAFRFLSRRLPRGASLGLAALLVTIGAEGTQNAVANGDTRSLSFYHTHSHERLAITFKKNGRYDPAALKKLNYFLRDWRNQKQTNMDPRLFDVIWEVYKDSGARSEVHIVSSYRSPETNAGLRSRTSGVAKNSQHTLGKAMDIHIPGINMAKVREAGLRLQRGGVGFYPKSGLPFVHLDVGNVRHWPRMTRTELARVFPDGRTVHVPSDGKPLQNYALALADVRRSGASVKGQPAPKQSEILMASASSGSSGGNFISRLLGADEDEDSAPAAAPAAPARAVASRDLKSETTPSDKRAPERAPVPAPSAAVAIAQAAPVPVPAARPAMAYAEPEVPAGPQMAWSRGPEATLRGSSEPAREMAALSTATTPVSAPALPMPRPQANAVTPAAVVARAEPAPVPVPVLRPAAEAPVTASLGVPSDLAARLVASAMRRVAGAETPAAPAAKPAPAPVAVTAEAKPVAPAAVSQQKSARDQDVVLAHPQVDAIAGLIAPPAAIVPASFGANPTGGLRSDAFAGAAVVNVRTERFAASQPRAARIVDVRQPRG
ncbi:DUF882 domain-containing protein [Terrihabitans sp. B22-R8]|uniref:DUF882 domain-containing protein n=1 Tax=Terrihabitans sp. B22-R8 TaxID=3425128 RepID=UPI00403CE2BB